MRTENYTSFSPSRVSMERLWRLFDWYTPGSCSKRYCIKNELKRNIYLSALDMFVAQIKLPASSICENLDLEPCANLQFYFKPAYREIILDKITKTMIANGLLITGKIKRELLKQQGFTNFFCRSGIFCL